MQQAFMKKRGKDQVSQGGRGCAQNHRRTQHDTVLLENNTAYQNKNQLTEEKSISSKHATTIIIIHYRIISLKIASYIDLLPSIKISRLINILI